MFEIGKFISPRWSSCLEKSLPVPFQEGKNLNSKICTRIFFFFFSSVVSFYKEQGSVCVFELNLVVPFSIAYLFPRFSANYMRTHVLHC